MALLLGAVAWGLIAIAVIGHVWHHDQLRTSLAVHTDHEHAAAAALVGLEVLVAISVPVLVLVGSPLVRVVAIVLTVLGLGFTVWIARLLASGSDAPCACSFSAGPTSPWSLVRSLLLLGGLGLLADVDTSSAGDASAVLVVGLALASAIYVVPEALSWPEISRAQLARIESHSPLGTEQGSP
jgi:hypothetical protein